MPFMKCFEVLSKAIEESKFQDLLSKRNFKQFFGLYEEDPNGEFLIYQIGLVSGDKKYKFLFNYGSGNVEVFIGPFSPGERDFTTRLGFGARIVDEEGVNV